MLIGYLECEDFEAARRGDGGDRRERALAGRDGASSSWSLEGRRPDEGLLLLDEVFHLD